MPASSRTTQSIRIGSRQLIHPTHGTSGEKYSRRVLQTLHPLMRGNEGLAHRRRTMIRQQKRVVRGEKWLHRIRKLFRSWCGVRHERNRSHLQDNFRQHWRHERFAGDRKARGGRRVRMDDRSHVVAPAVNAKVHGQLARRRAPAIQHLSIKIDDDEIIEGNIHLREPAGCN